MNDKMEGTLLLDKFFTDSRIKERYHEQLSQIEKEEGNICSISFCQSDNKSMEMGSIPMWSMYGDKGNGTILVFDFGKLKTYEQQIPSLLLRQCIYKSANDLKDYVKNKNDEISKAEDKIAYLSKLREDAFCLKDWHWAYEGEWRILTKSHNIKIKSTAKGVVAYAEVPIPIYCLRKIIVGPRANEMSVRILQETKNSLCEDDKSLDIRIIKSNLQIR